MTYGIARLYFATSEGIIACKENGKYYLPKKYLAGHNKNSNKKIFGGIKVMKKKVLVTVVLAFVLVLYPIVQVYG